MGDRPDILVTGASGFIGRGLAAELLARGRSLRGLCRNPPGTAAAGLEMVTGDLLRAETLPPVLAGIDTAYYLVHSLGAGPERFRALDRRAAENFTAAAEAAGVRRVIYLSGLGRETEPLSTHLSSRGEVAAILAAGAFRTTVLRAAIILGAGGASFELLRFLVGTQLLLPDAPVLQTRCQPIARTDVLRYLADCLDCEGTAGRRFDICGPEIVSYRELLERVARAAGTVNLFVPAPAIPAALVGRWVGLLSRQRGAVVEALLEGLHNEVVCEEQGIRQLIPFAPTPLDRAIALALAESPAA